MSRKLGAHATAPSQHVPSGPDAILATLREVGRRARASTEVPPQTPSSEVSTRKTLDLDMANNRKHDLLPMLSHEIGNQLTVIQGFAEMLADGIGNGLPPETAREFAESIVRNAKQMSGLLETVSEVQKLDQGTLELQIVDVDFAALVRKMIGDGLLGGRPLTLELSSDANVQADPARVGQILGNLLANAAKFTPADTPVAIAVTGDDRWVELAITDEGPGVPEDQQDQLFEKFSRLDAKVKGTGMSLYLARGIARAHGGDLQFLLQDRGCRFVLRLPRSAGAIPS